MPFDNFVILSKFQSISRCHYTELDRIVDATRLFKPERNQEKEHYLAISLLTIQISTFCNLKSKNSKYFIHLHHSLQQGASIHLSIKIK